MSEHENNIGWTDATTNCVTGCSKVSPGCRNCYAEAGTRARVLRAQGIETWGPKGVRHPVAEFAKKIRRLNGYKICDRCHYLEPIGGDDCRKCSASTLRRIRLFADSNSDFLDDKWPVETLAAFLKEIHDAPNIDFQLLTKRPENWRDRVCAAMEFYDKDWMHDGGARSVFATALGYWLEAATPERGLNGRPFPNIWLGVSVENQEMADLRIRQLLQIPAAVRFLSCEPILEETDIQSALGHNHGCGDAPADPDCDECGWLAKKVDWVIVGGESGEKRRDVPVEAITGIADQCKEAGVPVYVKQDVAFKSGQQGRIPAEYWAMKEFPR